MNNLLKFELKKLFTTKSFYVCLILSAVFIILNGMAVHNLIKDGQEIVNSGFLFAKKAINNGNVLILSGIFVALFVCEDETSGTIKNIYAKGYSRTQVFIAKFIVSLSGVLLMTFVSILSAFLIGTILWKNTIPLPNHYYLTLLTQVIIVMAYHSIFFAISIISGKLGTSIAFNIVGPMLIKVVLSMSDAFLKNNHFKLTNYWLDSFMINLTQEKILLNDVTIAILLCILYAITFSLIGLKLNQKKEIK